MLYRKHEGIERSVNDLRVDLKVAKARAQFANGATLPVASMVVAIIAALVVLLQEGNATDQKAESANSDAILVLGLVAAVLLAVGFWALIRRRAYAVKVIEAADRLKAAKSRVARGEAVEPLDQTVYVFTGRALGVAVVLTFALGAAAGLLA